MAESALSLRKIAAKHRVHAPLSVKSDILGFGGRHSSSLRQTLARMQLPFVDDVKYCNPNRLDEFDVHFVVIAPAEDAGGNPIAVPTATNSVTEPGTGTLFSGADLFRREVEILNQYFVKLDRSSVSTVTADGEQQVRFRYKSHHYLEEIEETGEILLEHGRQLDYAELTGYGDINSVGYYGDVFRGRLWACDDRRFVDPLAINVFIFDRRDPGSTPGTVIDTRTSGGSEGRHSDGSDRYRPFMLWDWTRILHRSQVEEHEMGHVFDLHHVCDPDVGNPNDPSETRPLNSNIMQGSGCHGPGYPPSENGLRNEGFGVVQHEQYHFDGSFDQVAAIIEMAWKLQSYWGDVYRSRWPQS